MPPCAAVRRLAALPGVRALEAVPRPPVAVVSLADLTRPSSWTPGFVSGSVDPRGSGSATTTFRSGSGSYAVWIAGSFLGGFSAWVDGRPLGSVRQQLEWSGQLVELGETRLAGGVHRLELRYDAGGWRPGTHGLAPFPAGPLVVAPTAPPRLVRVAPARAESLCGRRLDWVEAVG